MPAVSGKRWVTVAFVFAFLAVVAYFVVASVAMDDGDDATPSSGSLHVERTGDAVAPFAGLTLTRLAIGGDCKELVVADTLAERVAGLRDRETAAPYDGMIFVFDGPTTTNFTMAGVTAPLDIAFYDGDGRPVSHTSMEPCAKAESECPVYRADGEFVFAVETRPGELPSGALGTCA